MVLRMHKLVQKISCSPRTAEVLHTNVSVSGKQISICNTTRKHSGFRVKSSYKMIYKYKNI